MIDIDSLTVKQIREISALAASLSGGCKPSEGTSTNYPERPPVIVRAYSGVFFGYLVSKNGAEVKLKDARHIWSWDSTGMTDKVQTCEDIASRGLGSGSKMSSPAPAAIIEQVGATLWVTPEAEQILVAQKWSTR